MNEDFLNMLVCPLTHDPLRREGDVLINVKWGIKYPIRDGIPVMLLDQAELPPGINNLEELMEKIKLRR